MILISSGRACLKLGISRHHVINWSGRVASRGVTTKPLPADLAGLIPTLEDLGLGSGDNGNFGL